MRSSAIKTWPMSTAAMAAGMQASATRQWFSTGVLNLSGIDRKSTGSGDHCGLSRRRVYQVAITKALTRLGVSASTAANAAAAFTDDGQPGRSPGELFPFGTTLLLIGPNGANVYNAFHDTPLADVNAVGVCVILELNRLVEHVDSILKEV